MKTDRKIGIIDRYTADRQIDRWTPRYLCGGGGGGVMTLKVFICLGHIFNLFQV